MSMINLPLQRPRIVAVLAVVLALAACTSSLVYNRLDTVARWYIGNLVTLDDSQQTALRDWLARTLAWHRDSELTRYEQFLRDLAVKVSAGPDPALYPETVRQAEGFMRELAARVAPEAATLLTTLQPAQLEELLTNLKKRNLEELDEERERTTAERQERRSRSITRNLERWTGASTPEQQAIIERTVADMATAGMLGEDDEWLASQTAWRENLRQALAKGAETQAQVEALLKDPESSYTASYREAQTAERRRFLDLVIELDATLTLKQRATLATKLTELAADLGALTRTS